MSTRWVVALVAGLLLSIRLGPAAAQEMTVLQNHAGNNFRPSFRIAADAVYLRGGNVSIDGVSSDECRDGVPLWTDAFRPATRRIFDQAFLGQLARCAQQWQLRRHWHFAAVLLVRSLRAERMSLQCISRPLPVLRRMGAHRCNFNLDPGIVGRAPPDGSNQWVEAPVGLIRRETASEMDMIESRRHFIVVFSTFGLTVLGWTLPAARFTEKEEREIYAVLDPDGAGKVTREQFDARKMNAFYLHRYPDAGGRMKPLTFEETGLSREFFDRADTDHDGLLDGIEMIDAVHFEDIDIKGRGYFDFSDLAAYLKKIGR